MTNPNYKRITYHGIFEFHYVVAQSGDKTPTGEEDYDRMYFRIPSKDKELSWTEWPADWPDPPKEVMEFFFGPLIIG